MPQYLLRDLHGQLHVLDLQAASIRGSDLAAVVWDRFAIPISEQRLIANGKDIDAHSHVQQGSEIAVLLRLEGGKGGFGSMLRAMGKNLHKTTNFGAMRDLSGRRLRHTHNEKELSEWIADHRKLSHREYEDLKSEYKSISETGRFLEKRLCPFGDDCRYMWKCKYRHPCEIESDRDAEERRLQEEREKNKPLGSSFGLDPNDPFAGMYDNHSDLKGAVMAGLRQGKKRKLEEMKKKLEKDRENSLEVRRHSYHPGHDLIFGEREFDWIMCDRCNQFFTGASWHCKDGLDFDLCTACVRIDENAPKSAPEKEPIKYIPNRQRRMLYGNKIVKDPRKKKKKAKKKKVGAGSLDSLGLNFEMGFEEIPLRMELLFPNINKLLMKKLEEPPDKKRKLETPAVDISKHTVESLKELGLDVLKHELQRYKLKCGGNLQQRAERLLLVKTCGVGNIPKKHRAKPKSKFKRL